MHECMNIVAGPEGTGGCVLIRALEPVAGLDLMRARRPAAKTDRELTSGPGKLTKAMAITRAHYGADLTTGDLTVHAPARVREIEIEVTPRIGISKCEDWPLRFLIRGNPFVSR